MTTMYYIVTSYIICKNTYGLYNNLYHNSVSLVSFRTSSVLLICLALKRTNLILLNISVLIGQQRSCNISILRLCLMIHSNLPSKF